MELKFLDIILIVLFFQLLTLCPYLLFHKTNRGISNRLLGLFLLAKALCITNFLSFRLYDYTMEFFPHAFYFGSSFTILWGPLLYLYIASLTNANFKFTYKHLIHFIPFFIHFLWISFSIQIKSADAIRAIMDNGGIFNHLTWTIYSWSRFIYILTYTIATLPLIKKYHTKAREHLSSISSINLSWMNFIIAGFLVKLSADLWYQLAEHGTLSSKIAVYFSRFVLFLFINIMMYKGLKRPTIWQGELEVVKDKKETLSKDSKEKYLAKLLEYNQKYKPYLNPDITLEELAGSVKIPPRSLSTVLNECLNQNFYDFINSNRVKESQRLLKASESKDKTVLEILYEVGFNSKSSFNTAFKKNTNLTPTAYKKIHLKKVS